MYAGGSSGAVATALESVQVAPIQDGRAGWLVRAALEERLGRQESDTPRYRLEVELDDAITGFGIRSGRRGDPRAAEAARALSAPWTRNAARSCSTPPPDRMRASTSVCSGICDRGRRTVGA